MNLLDTYTVTYTCPSNIALIKYWGKFATQFPQNPSISMTLSECLTETTVHFTRDESMSQRVELLFEGRENVKFQDKLSKFLVEQESLFPWLKSYALRIESHNTFPHSAGIASSASSMGALSMCLNDFDSKLNDKETLDSSLCSSVARLGSGSASRSVFGNYAIWGKCFVEKSSNEHAIEYNDFSKEFSTLRDAVLIVNEGEKAVSSRQGHALMDNHPFKEVRYKNAHHNLELLLKAMSSGDTKSFVRIVESEALELHGLMMNSNPSFILMKPNTLSIIEEIRNFRVESGVDICFTLDAGPNVHLLYFEKDSDVVKAFIRETLLPLTHEATVIYDQIGSGPKKILC